MSADEWTEAVRLAKASAAVSRIEAEEGAQATQSPVDHKMTNAPTVEEMGVKDKPVPAEHSTVLQKSTASSIHQQAVSMKLRSKHSTYTSVSELRENKKH